MANNQIALLAKAPVLDTPLESQAKAMQIRQLMNQGEVQDMDMQAKRQTMEEDSIARAAFTAHPTDSAARLKELARAPKAYAAERKALHDAENTAADIGKKKADTRNTEIDAARKAVDIIGQAMGFVFANPTLANANSTLDQLEGHRLYSPEQVASMRQMVNSNPTPENIKMLAEQGMRAATDTKDQLAKIDTRNLGNRMETRSIDPITGKETILGSQAIGQSPDSVASNATQRRGQNMTDARAREQNETAGRGVIIQTDDGPMLANSRTGTTKQIIGPDGNPVTRVKPPTEFQGKSAAFGARADQADKIITSLQGKYNPSAINAKQAVEDVWLVGGALGAATNKFALNENDQKAEQAQRDFINAVLRQESGAAIGASEFDNAKKQYFPQPGDKPATLKQKAENRRLAVKGFQANAGRAGFSTDAAAPDAPPALPAGWSVEPQ